MKHLRFIFKVSILFYLCTVEGASVSQCRVPENEGWAWADSSMIYKDEEGAELNFFNIHGKLREKHEILFLKLQSDGGKSNSSKPNICVAQFNLLIKPIADDGPTELFFPYSDSNLHPIKPLVFVSGANAPKLAGITYNQNQIDSHSNEKNEQGQKDKMPQILEWSGYKLCLKYDTIEESEKRFFQGLRIIHPSSNSFLSLPEIARRLDERYRQSGFKILPPKAQLAREWLALKNEDSIVLPDQIAQRDEIYRKKDHWYKRAVSPSSFHADLIRGSTNSKKAVNDDSDNITFYDSHEIFFEYNADSEQKLFFFFNCISDCVEGFRLLQSILDKLDYYEKVKYRKALIISLMTHCNSQTRKVREAIAELKVTSDAATEDELNKDFQALYLYCTEARQRRKIVYLTELINLTAAADARFKYLHQLDLSNCYDASNISNEAESEADRQNNLLKELSRVFCSKKNELNPLVDDTIVQFDQLVTECLRKKPNHYICALVLNVHSTNDICHSCAPDLAQESWREDNFADYFVETITRRNPKQRKPFFRAIYSCGSIRKKQCCSQCLSKKIQPLPTFRSPIGVDVAYNQHFFPSEDDPDNDKQGVTRLDQGKHSEEASKKSKPVKISNDISTIYSYFFPHTYFIPEPDDPNNEAQVAKGQNVSLIQDQAKNQVKEGTKKNKPNDSLQGVLREKDTRSKELPKFDDEDLDDVVPRKKKKDHSVQAKGPRVVEEMHMPTAKERLSKPKTEPINPKNNDDDE